jgi:hypothetical protein
MRARAPEQEELIVHVAETHASTRSR